MKSINKVDYELYSFLLPIKYIFGKKKTTFIFDELERRHPCFNDSFCFDSSVKIRNKKLWVDVVVMKKIKLAEYKNSSRFSFLGFGLEEKKGESRFGIKCIYIVFLIFIFCIGSLFFYFSKYTDRKTSEENNPETEYVYEDYQIVLEQPGFYGKHFLEIIDHEKGRISELYWKVSNSTEELKAVVKNIYPEVLGELKKDFKGKVEYEKNIPCFFFENAWPVCRSKENQYTKINELREEIRSLMSSENCTLIEEKMLPITYKFNEKNGNSFFIKLAELLKEYDAGVSEISISVNDSENLLVEIMLSEKLAFADGIPIEDISNHKSIFNFYNEKKDVLVSNKREKTNIQRIGAIGYENGNQIVFYKNEKGKIIKIVEKL